MNNTENLNLFPLDGKKIIKPCIEISYIPNNYCYYMYQFLNDSGGIVYSSFSIDPFLAISEKLKKYDGVKKIMISELPDYRDAIKNIEYKINSEKLVDQSIDTFRKVINDIFISLEEIGILYFILLNEERDQLKVTEISTFFSSDLYKIYEMLEGLVKRNYLIRVSE